VEMDTGEEKETRDFRVKQKIVSLRPVYEIYDEQTDEKLAVGRQTWLSVFRSTINFEDPNGNPLLTAKGGFFDKTFWLKDPDGEKVAKLTRPWIAFRKNFKIHYRDDLIKAQGGFLAWGFDAYNSAGRFAFQLNKKIISVRDQFVVRVGDYMDWLHAVASAVVVDRIFFKGKGGFGRCIICIVLLAVLFAVSIGITLLGP